MNDNLYYICNDIYVSDESYVTNDEISHYLRSNDIDSDPITTRAALHKTKLWPKDSILNVVFLGGDEWQKAWVEKVVKEQLEPYTNVKFSFDPNGKRTIRVSFKPNDGAYSAVGTDALMRSLDQPTMNLGWLDAPGTRTEPGKFKWKGKTYNVPAGQPRNKNVNGATVMHEFGHALGFIHEHQNPRGEGIKWDTNKVYSYFSGPPNKWDRDTTFRNVLKKYNETQINGSKFDPDSIMLYFFDGKLTTDGKGTHMNTNLSELDKKWLKRAYAGGLDKKESSGTPSQKKKRKTQTPSKQEVYNAPESTTTPKKTPTSIPTRTITKKTKTPQIIIQQPTTPAPPPLQQPVQPIIIPLPPQQCQQQQQQQNNTCIPLPVAANFLNSLLPQGQQLVPPTAVPQIPFVPSPIVQEMPPQVQLPPQVSCPPGYARNASGTCELQPCAPGYHRNSQGACVRNHHPHPIHCPPGYHRDGYGRCVKNCPPGYHKDAYGRCVKNCPVGYHKNVKGQCVKNCAPGYRRDLRGICVPDYYRSENSNDVIENFDINVDSSLQTNSGIKKYLNNKILFLIALIIIVGIIIYMMKTPDY